MDVQTVVNTIIDGNSIGYSVSGALIRNISSNSSCMLVGGAGVALYTKAGSIDAQKAMAIGYPSWFVSDTFKGSFIECKPMNATSPGYPRRNIDASVMLSPFIPSWWERRPNVVAIDAVFLQSAVSYLEPVIPSLIYGGGSGGGGDGGNTPEMAVAALNGMLDALIKLPPHATLADIRCIDLAYNSTERDLNFFFGVIAQAIRRFVPHLKITFDNSECETVNGDPLSAFLARAIPALLSGSGKEYGYATLEIVNESDDAKSFYNGATTAPPALVVPHLQQLAGGRTTPSATTAAPAAAAAHRRRLCSSRIVSIVCSEFSEIRNVHAFHFKASADLSALQSRITSNVLYAYYDQKEPFHNVQALVALRGASQRNAIVRPSRNYYRAASTPSRYHLHQQQQREEAVFNGIANMDAQAIADIIVKAKAAHVESLYFPIPATRSCNVVPVHISAKHFSNAGASVDVRGFDTLDLGYFNVPLFLYDGLAASSSSSLRRLRSGFPDAYEWYSSIRNETAPMAIEWNRIARTSNSAQLAENVSILLDDRIVHIGVTSLKEFKLAIDAIDPTSCTAIRVHNIPPSIIAPHVAAAAADDGTDAATAALVDHHQDATEDRDLDARVARKWHMLRLSEFTLSITSNDKPLAEYVRRLFLHSGGGSGGIGSVLSTCKRLIMNVPDDVIVSVIEATPQFRALTRAEISVHRMVPETVGDQIRNLCRKAPSLRTLVICSEGEPCADTMQVLLGDPSLKCPSLDTLQVWGNDAIHDSNYGRFVNLGTQRLKNRDRARITFPNIRYCTCSCPAWNFTGNPTLNNWFTITPHQLQQQRQQPQQSFTKLLQIDTQQQQPYVSNTTAVVPKQQAAAKRSRSSSSSPPPAPSLERAVVKAYWGSETAAAAVSTSKRSSNSSSPPTQQPPPPTPTSSERGVGKSAAYWDSGSEAADDFYFEQPEQPQQAITLSSTVAAASAAAAASTAAPTAPILTQQHTKEEALKLEQEKWDAVLGDESFDLVSTFLAPEQSEKPPTPPPQELLLPDDERGEVMSIEEESPPQPATTADDVNSRMDELDEMLRRYRRTASPSYVTQTEAEDLATNSSRASSRSRSSESSHCSNSRRSSVSSTRSRSSVSYNRHSRSSSVSSKESRRRRRRHDETNESEALTDTDAPTTAKQFSPPPPPPALPLPQLESDIGTIYGYGSSITKVIEAAAGNEGDDEDDGGLEEDTIQHGMCYDDIPNGRSVAYNNSYIARATGKLY